MSYVHDILVNKGRQVFSVGPDATVLEAALLMNEHRIGSLVVMEAGQVIGIVTERDILRRVVVNRLDPASTPLGTIMTTEVVCCEPGTTIDEARSVLKNRRIRHLPVCDDGRGLCGLISIGDLNAYHAHDREHTIHVLQEYISGRV
jgi:CBS domain-containing protein